MKQRILLLIVIVFLSLNSFAQNTNNIVIFSQAGERFYVILNGVRQNIDPETNVKVVDLDQPGYKLKVIFENKSLPNVDKSLYFPGFGKEYVFDIVNKKGKYKIGYVSEKPIASTATTVPDQKIVYYGQAPDTIVTKTTTTTTTTNTPSDNVVTTASNTNATVTTNTTANTSANTLTTSTNTDGISININETGMSVNGVGMDVNVQTNGMNAQTTTTTNSNTSSSGSVSSDHSSQFVSNGTMCSYGTLSKDQFVKLKFSIDEKTYVTKMNYTKDNVKQNCMEAAQVAELVKLFDYSSDQLELAKFCYQYTYDTKNYDLVVNALKHEYNKPKLLEVIGTSSGSSSNTTTTTVNPSTTTTTTTVVEEKVIVPATTTTTASSTSGCYTPMADEDFATAKKSIESKSFEDSRLTLAKQIIKNKCLSVKQVKEIMLVFSFEQTRLDFAKLAYDYTYDKSNYYQLNDAFTFESSIDDLNSYLESK